MGMTYDGADGQYVLQWFDNSFDNNQNESLHNQMDGTRLKRSDLNTNRTVSYS